MLETRYRVFVYGTLIPGERYYRQICLGRTLLERPGRIRGKLYHLPEPLNYPALTHGEGWVHGWLLGFDDRLLMRELDILEGYDAAAPPEQNEYSRQRVAVIAVDGTLLAEAEAYFMTEAVIARHHGIIVPDGRWREDPPRLSGGTAALAEGLLP